MKKLLAMILALALAFSLAACGGGTNPTGGNSTTNPPASTAGNSTADNNGGNQGAAGLPSITPADGFVKNDASPWPVYNKTGDSAGSALSIVISSFTLNSTYPTLDAYIPFVQDGLKGALKDMQFSATTDTTVNGMAASEFTYTSSMQNGRQVYINQSGKVYIIQCMATDAMSNPSALWDANAADFQAMIDSFTLN